MKTSIGHKLTNLVSSKPQEVTFDKALVGTVKREASRALVKGTIPTFSSDSVKSLEKLQMKYDLLVADNGRTEMNGGTCILFNDMGSVKKRISQLHSDVIQPLLDKNIATIVSDMQSTMELDQLGVEPTYTSDISSAVRLPERVLVKVLQDNGGGDPESIEFALAKKAYGELDLNSLTVLEDAEIAVTAARARYAKCVKFEEVLLMQKVVATATNRLNLRIKEEAFQATRTQQVTHNPGFFERVRDTMAAVKEAANNHGNVMKAKPTAKNGFREMVRSAEVN